MKPGIQFWIIAIIISGCSSAAKLRRAEKLIAKAETLGAKWHVDSVQIEIPVPIESVRVDTIQRVLPGDSIVIYKDRLKVIVRRVAKDTIMIEAECQADTIRIKHTVTINKTIKAKGYSLWQLVILALVMLLAGYGVRAFMRR